MRRMLRRGSCFACAVGLAAAAWLVVRPVHADEPATGTGAAPTAPSAAPAADAKGHHESADAPGLPNFRRLSDHFLRGGKPEGEVGFATLARLGVKTVVTVDGAAPDVELAKKYGLEYVHVPIGYDGIPPEKALALEKTFTTAKGPFYVHCHHGQHRGPAACALGRMMIDGATAEKALEEMKDAGTDPKYTGLYAVPAKYVKPDPAALAATPLPPAVAPIPPLAEAMVAIDLAWDRMKAVKKAGFTVSADHPDVDPAHEAVILAEHFRELARRPEVAEKPEDFRRHLGDAEKAAWDLSKALAEPSTGKPPAAASAAFDRVAKSCSTCHAGYRDHK